MIAERYGVAKSTISDIKKNSDKILRFKQEMCDMRMSKKSKVLKLGDDVQLLLVVQANANVGRSRDQDEQEFVCEFQELGYSMDENEIHTWLNSDCSECQ